jgi:hypothetical protein
MRAFRPAPPIRNGRASRAPPHPSSWPDRLRLAALSAHAIGPTRAKPLPTCRPARPAWITLPWGASPRARRIASIATARRSAELFFSKASTDVPRLLSQSSCPHGLRLSGHLEGSDGARCSRITMAR